MGGELAKTGDHEQRAGNEKDDRKQPVERAGQPRCVGLLRVVADRERAPVLPARRRADIQPLAMRRPRIVGIFDDGVVAKFVAIVVAGRVIDDAGVDGNGPVVERDRPVADERTDRERQRAENDGAERRLAYESAEGSDGGDRKRYTRDSQ